jgi:hypothetical protein
MKMNFSFIAGMFRAYLKSMLIQNREMLIKELDANMDKFAVYGINYIIYLVKALPTRPLFQKILKPVLTALILSNAQFINDFVLNTSGDSAEAIIDALIEVM